MKDHDTSQQKFPNPEGMVTNAKPLHSQCDIPFELREPNEGDDSRFIYRSSTDGGKREVETPGSVIMVGELY